MNKMELLAPAGSSESLKAAINAGANAVYLAGRQFGARRSASNFSNEEISEVIRYCHERNVAVYVTLNTLIKSSEMADALGFVEFLYNNDVDAVILQDIGLLSNIKATYPDLQCHASTQMTLHNLSDVKWAESVGFTRVVLSRELSFNEIKEIAEKTNVEIELFVHGALCISYSGQCLMSSLIGGRSGNRGACAQPCRKAYTLVERGKELALNKSDQVYLMSPKDLNVYEHMDELKSLGNVSLKVEGRMKGPDYVYTVVSSYRKAMDDHPSKVDHEKLFKVFNRDFTEGHLFDAEYKALMNYELPSSYGTVLGKTLSLSDGVLTLQLTDDLNKGDEIQTRFKGKTVGTRTDVITKDGQRVATASAGSIVTVPFKYKTVKNSIFYKTYDKKHIDEAIQESLIEKPVHDISLFFEAHMNQHAKLIGIVNQTLRIEIVSEMPSEMANNRPLSSDRVTEQFSKLGGTPFHLNQFELNMDEGLVIPISELNRMRRALVDEALEVLSVWHPKRTKKSVDVVKIDSEEKEGNIELHLHFYTKEYMYESMEIADHKERDYDVIWFMHDLKAYENELKHMVESGIVPVLPRIARAENHEDFIEKYKKECILQNKIPRIGFSHVGHMDYLKRFDELSWIASETMNCFNVDSYDLLISSGAESVILSTELSVQELGPFKKRMHLGYYVYGNMPVMISEYCPVGGTMTGRSGCNLCKSGDYDLIDEKGMHFPIRCDADHCRVEILFGKTHNWLSNMLRLRTLGIRIFKMEFDRLNPAEEHEILGALSRFREFNNLVKTLPQFNDNFHITGKGVE
jgi:putative protease